MELSIFRNDILVVSVKPSDNSELRQTKQVEDVILLNFSLPTFVELKIGDQLIFTDWGRYTLYELPKVTEAPQNYQYECLFKGLIHSFSQTKLLLLTEKEGGGNYIDYKYPLTGDASTFLQLIVQNLNRTGSGFVQGVSDPTEIKTIEVNDWNVLEALNYLSEQFKVDWYLDGQTLNFSTPNVETAYVLRVGRLIGLMDLTRYKLESKDLVTVVWGFGGTQNMPPRSNKEGLEYDSQVLTENRLCFVGEGGESKLSNNTALYGVREIVKEFDDIYPEFTGTVITPRTDIKQFIDNTITFDINEQLIAGITPKITFLTGRLLGLTFNISWDNDNKIVTMDTYTNESGDYPNDTIKCEAGDTYKLFDIIMPESYLTAAALRLQQATQDELNTLSNPAVYYEANLDEKYLETYGLTLTLGNKIRIISAAFNLDGLFEIKALTKNIVNPYKVQIKFGDSLPKNLLYLLRFQNWMNQQNIYKVSKTTVSNSQITNILGETSWESL